MKHIYCLPQWNQSYRQTSNIRCTLVGNKIVDHSDIVGVLALLQLHLHSLLNICVTVVTCAKFRCDHLITFSTRALQILV